MGALLVFLVDVGYCVMVVVGQKGLVECELYKMVVWTLVMPVPGIGFTLKQQDSKKKTCYAQIAQVKNIRWR